MENKRINEQKNKLYSQLKIYTPQNVVLYQSDKWRKPAATICTRRKQIIDNTNCLWMYIKSKLDNIKHTDIEINTFLKTALSYHMLTFWLKGGEFLTRQTTSYLQHKYEYTEKSIYFLEINVRYSCSVVYVNCFLFSSGCGHGSRGRSQTCGLPVHWLVIWRHLNRHFSNFFSLEQERRIFLRAHAGNRE